MSEFKRLSVSDAKQMIDSTAVTLVDIRDEESFAAGHITQSLHLDNSVVQEFVQHADMDQSLIVCCYHGHSSQSAAAYFVQQGFSDVYSLDGGFTEWQQAYPEDCTTL